MRSATAPSNGDAVNASPAGEEVSASSEARNRARQVFQWFRTLQIGRVLFQYRRSAKHGHHGKVQCLKCPWFVVREKAGKWFPLRRSAVEHVQHVHAASFAAHCGAVSQADGAE